MKIKELGSRIRQRITRGRYVGSLDSSDYGVLRGWVMDRNNPDSTEKLDVLIDNVKVDSVLAGEVRKDLLDLGHGKGRHGYSVQLHDHLCDDRVHEICLKVMSKGRVLWSFTTEIHLSVRPENWRDIRGNIDHVNGLTVTGWACAWGAPQETVTVSLRTADGKHVATTVADQIRTDLSEAGIGNGAYGFVFDLQGAIPVNSPRNDSYTVTEDSSGLPIGQPMAIDSSSITVMADPGISQTDLATLGLNQGFESVYEISAHTLGVAPRSPKEADDPFKGRNVAVLTDAGVPLDVLPKAFRAANSVTVLSINPSIEQKKLKDMWPAWHSATLKLETVHTLMPKFSGSDTDCALLSTTAIKGLSDAVKDLARDSSVYPEFMESYGDLLVEPLESYLYSEVYRRLSLCDMMMEKADCLCLVLGHGLNWLSILDIALAKESPKHIYLHVADSRVHGTAARRTSEALRAANISPRKLVKDKAIAETVRNAERDVVTHLDVAIETTSKLVAAEGEKSDEIAAEPSHALEVFLQLGGNYSHAFVGSGLSDLLRQFLEHRDIQISFTEKNDGKAQASFDQLKSIVGTTRHSLHYEPCSPVDSRALKSVRRYQRALMELLRTRQIITYDGLNCANMAKQFIESTMAERSADILNATHRFRMRYASRKPHGLLTYPGAETIARTALRAAKEAGVPTADCQMIFVADDPRNSFNWRQNADQLFVLDDTFGSMFINKMNWPKNSIETVGSVRIDNLLNTYCADATSKTVTTSKNGNNKTIMLAMQPYAEAEMKIMLSAARRLALSNPDYKVLVRPHPIESTQTHKEYLDYLYEHLNAEQVIDGDGDDLGKSFLSVDVVVSVSSNILLEAACMDVDCVIANVSKFSMPHPMNIDEWGIAEPAKTEEEMINVVSKIFSDPEFLEGVRRRRKDYFQINPRYLDGQSANRIVQSLVH